MSFLNLQFEKKNPTNDKYRRIKFKFVIIVCKHSGLMDVYRFKYISYKGNIDSSKTYYSLFR